jgi:hypothetical protein
MKEYANMIDIDTGVKYVKSPEYVSTVLENSTVENVRSAICVHNCVTMMIYCIKI